PPSAYPTAQWGPSPGPPLKLQSVTVAALPMKGEGRTFVSKLPFRRTGAAQAETESVKRAAITPKAREESFMVPPSFVCITGLSTRQGRYYAWFYRYSSCNDSSAEAPGQSFS